MNSRKLDCHLLSHTFDHINAFVALKQDQFVALMQDQSFIGFNRPPSRYDEIILSPIFLYKDESISDSAYQVVLYQSSANFFEVEKRSFELKQQLIEVVEQNLEFPFDWYKIRNMTTGEIIEEGTVEELMTSSKNEE